MDITFILYLLGALAIATGLAGIVVPALPGLPLVFLGALFIAWADDFTRIGWIPLAILAVLAVLSVLVDIFGTVIGAQRVGASGKALWGTAIGSVVGLFFMPIGLLAGPLAGALLGEYWHSRELGRATKVGLATWVGILVGFALNIALAVAMLGLLAFAWFF